MDIPLVTLQTVIDNLDRTIAGKMTLKDALERHGPIFARLLEVNVDELKRIREDLLKVRENS